MNCFIEAALALPTAASSSGSVRSSRVAKLPAPSRARSTGGGRPDSPDITPAVVAAVWHKWLGDAAREPEPSAHGMDALAADLQSVQQDFGK